VSAVPWFLAAGAAIAGFGLVVPRWGGATIMSPAGPRRWSVVTTDRRVILAHRTLTGKRMVMYVLWLGRSPDMQSRKLGGGVADAGVYLDGG